MQWLLLMPSAVIHRLAKRLAIRQQAMATAQVYIKRFYCCVEIRQTNPYLLVATAVYLACKIEECPQHIRLIVQEARSLWGEFITGDTSRLGEYEFWMISEMSSQLIVYQPYKTLQGLQAELGLTQEDTVLAWSIINDHYMTDIPLRYAPNTVALMAIILALVLKPSSAAMVPQTSSSGASTATGVMAGNAPRVTQALALAQGRTSSQTAPQTPQTPTGLAIPTTAQTPKDLDRIQRVQRFATWLAESKVDIEGMVNCCQVMISFYDSHEQYKERDTREQMNRFIKARGLDK